MEALFAAWHEFARGKRKREDVMAWERHLEDNIFQLHAELRDGEYAHDPYAPFRVYDPKERQIHKATVKDRVVHQAIYTAIEPLFEKRFIYDSYSCRKNKGTHAASRRLQKFCRRASKNNTRTVYALQLDIRRFFDSVDHKILLELLESQVANGQMMDLLEQIVGSFAMAPGKGLPLGNLTSQLFANVYLHGLDYFVKHGLKEQWYLRYCDDFIILTASHAKAIEHIRILQKFLNSRLKLSIHPEKIRVKTWNQGIDFVGYVHMPHCAVVRTKTARRMFKLANDTNLSSYLGLCGHANAYELERTLLNKIG
ncbi:MAG: reverse transcriptase/maturase family protein [Patescibacteria group bacterium]